MYHPLPTSPPRAIITGASGQLGCYLCSAFARQFECIAISHRQSIPECWASLRIRQDLQDYAVMKAILDRIKPIAIVHAAAFADPNECEKNKKHSSAINVEVPRQLATECYKRGINFYFISTDLVFDGKTGNYNEQDPVNPINTYGEHKAQAEALLREVHPDAVVLRLPWLFGCHQLGTGNIRAWQAQLQTGQPLFGFVDEFRSAVSYSVAAKGIAQLIRHCEKGKQQGRPAKIGEIYHLGGIETVSRYFVLQQLARILSVNEQLILPKKRKEAILPAKRPADVSLDSRKARCAGYKTPFFEEMLRATLENSSKFAPEFGLRP